MKYFNLKNAFFSLLGSLLLGCAVEPQPIVYNQDSCHFCRMGIADQRYGSEIVTSTGKALKFDAIECMVQHILKGEKSENTFLLVNTYDFPGEFTPAAEATFLVSPNLPSPMGMYLTGFRNDKQALEAKDKFTGNLYSWQQLIDDFDSIKLALSHSY